MRMLAHPRLIFNIYFQHCQHLSSWSVNCQRGQLFLRPQIDCFQYYQHLHRSSIERQNRFLSNAMMFGPWQFHLFSILCWYFLPPLVIAMISISCCRGARIFICMVLKMCFGGGMCGSFMGCRLTSTSLSYRVLLFRACCSRFSSFFGMSRHLCIQYNFWCINILIQIRSLMHFYAIGTKMNRPITTDLLIF